MITILSFKFFYGSWKAVLTFLQYFKNASFLDFPAIKSSQWTGWSWLVPDTDIHLVPVYYFGSQLVWKLLLGSRDPWKPLRERTTTESVISKWILSVFGACMQREKLLDCPPQLAFVKGNWVHSGWWERWCHQQVRSLYRSVNTWSSCHWES